MKKITLLLLPVLLLLCLSCQNQPYTKAYPIQDNNNTTIYGENDKAIWSYDCGLYKPFVRGLYNNEFSFRTKYMQYIEIATGKHKESDEVDARTIDIDNKIVLRATNDNDYTLERTKDNDLVWRTLLYQCELVVFENDIYVYSNLANKLAKISYDEGMIEWTIKVDKALSSIFHSSDYLYLYSPLRGYTRVDNNAGKSKTVLTEHFVNNTADPNLAGFLIDGQLYYVNINKKLVRFPNLVVDNWAKVIGDKSCTVSVINNEIITYRWAEYQSSIYTSYEESISPLSLIIHPRSDKTLTCEVVVTNRNTKEQVSLNKKYDLNVRYAYTVNNKIVCFNKNDIQAFDEKLDHLWTLPYNQIPNYKQDDKALHVIWLNDDYVLVYVDEQFLTCFNISKLEATHK